MRDRRRAVIHHEKYQEDSYRLYIADCGKTFRKRRRWSPNPYIHHNWEEVTCRMCLKIARGQWEIARCVYCGRLSVLYSIRQHVKSCKARRALRQDWGQ